MSDQLDWSAVRDFLYRRPVVPVTTTISTPLVLPVAGTPDWIALHDDDRRKIASLIAAGSRWVLERNLELLDDERAARKAAAIEVAQAKDWARVAQRIRGRDAAYIERRKAS